MVDLRMVKRKIVSRAVLLFFCFITVGLYIFLTRLPDKRYVNIKFNTFSLQPSQLPPFQLQDSNLPDCPKTPPNLIGPIEVVTNLSLIKNLQHFSHLKNGHGQPANCKARNKVAIIVPFREREKHLPVFLYNLHVMLEKQQADYSIFVIEQTPNSSFNRAKLLNIGFIEASKIYQWDCIIFHDVDHIPEDDRNIYECSQQEPRHLSVAIDKFFYKLPYSNFMGGVITLTPQQMTKINGFSNDFWGWGGEDDDGYIRITINGYLFIRYSEDIARYKTIIHQRDRGNPKNPCRLFLMSKTQQRFQSDGLSNCNYRVVNSTRKDLYVHFLVDLFERESRERLRAEDEMFENC